MIILKIFHHGVLNFGLLTDFLRKTLIYYDQYYGYDLLRPNQRLRLDHQLEYVVQMNVRLRLLGRSRMVEGWRRHFLPDDDTHPDEIFYDDGVWFHDDK